MMSAQHSLIILDGLEQPANGVRDSLLPHQQAALLALVSSSSRLEWPQEPERVHCDALADALATLPTQLSAVSGESVFGQWLAIAGLAEQRELHEAARGTIDAVRHAVERADASVVGSTQALEWRAICWTRRGRISRICGHHEDAFECYAQASRLVRSLPWSDARPLAELGLAALSAARGNYPMVARHATLVLKHRPVLSVVHRFGAHLMMALAQRKRGELIDALLHGWAAIDMVPTGDVRALEVMLSLAEIAIELRDVRAAEVVFASVLEHSSPLRVRVSALAGAVASCVRLPSENIRTEIGTRLNRYRALLLQLLELRLAPRDECRTLFALAEIHRHEADLSGAADLTERAGSVARKFGFFEQQFRLDEFETQLMRSPFADSVRSFDAGDESFPPIPAHSVRHPALSRLFKFSTR